MTTQDSKPTAIVITVAGLILTILFVAIVVQSVMDDASINCQDSTTSSTQSLLTSSTATLTPIGEGITSSSATHKNKTWLEFDGQSDYVVISDSDILDMGNFTSFTLIAKFNTSDFTTGDDDVMISKRLNNARYNLNVNGSKDLELEISDGSVSRTLGFAPQIQVNDSNWHIGVGVVDRNEDDLFLYLDGISSDEIATGVSSVGNISNSQDLVIGSRSDNKDTREFNGSIDYVKIYNRVFHNNDVKYLNGNRSVGENNSIIPFFPLPYTKYEPLNLTDIEGISNPILNTTITGSGLNADPSLFIENGSYYLFFEQKGALTENIGVISLATSTNAIDWEYKGIVMNQSWHLSYPSIFKYNNEYFMTTDAGDRDDGNRSTLDIYKANNFPYNWTLNTTLLNLSNNGLGNLDDPNIFRWKDKWWAIYTGNNSENLEAGYGTDLFNASTWNFSLSINPIHTETKNKRLGGRPIVRDDYIILFTQDATGIYGNNTRAYKITTLNSSNYIDYEILNNTPILIGDGSGWNQDGMHTQDCWWDSYQDDSKDDEQWICAVDGIKNPIWGIGIYKSNDYGLMGEWNLNENSLTTAYDTSGNGNDGTISGATWQDDGVDVSLTEGTDYSITGDVFTILNTDYAWSGIDASWDFIIGENCAGIEIGYVRNSFGAFILAILSFIGIIGTVASILWLFKYIKPLFSKEGGLVYIQ